MYQHDFFAADEAVEQPAPPISRELDLPGILALLSDTCERPRYSFMVLNLIARASDRTGSLGPFVREKDRRVPVRDWLSDALMPVAQRDPRRLAIEGKVRKALEEQGGLPADQTAAQKLVDDHVQRRIRLSGRTNVSRAVSELVRAGLVHRHYQGYRVDHQNRGAQRQVVYTVAPHARRALAGGLPST